MTGKGLARESQRGVGGQNTAWQIDQAGNGTKNNLPYGSSEAGAGREKEIRQLLRDAGASAVGFMVDDDADTVTCQFRLVGRQITVPVNIGSYATAWLKANPCGPRTDTKTHTARARAQAEIAVWAILADWIKATTAMLICGLMDADTLFLPHILAPNGQRVIDTIKGQSGQTLLPPPETKP